MFGFLVKDYRRGLVYDGSVSMMNKVIDVIEADRRYKNRSGGDFQEIELEIFGDIRKITLPICSSNIKYEDISTEFNDYIREKSKKKVFSDVSVGYREQLLKSYAVVKNQSGWVCLLYTGEKKEKIMLKTTEEKADFVMLREFMGGYVRASAYPLVVIGSDGKDKVTMSDLHSDINTGGLGITIPNNYTLGLRNAMFGRVKEMFESDKLLQTRQYDLIEKFSKRTFVTAPRRAGKTRISAFLAIREIMRESFDIRRQGSPVQVLYIANKSEVFNTVVTYIKGMCKQLGTGFQNMFWRDTTTILNGKVLNFGDGRSKEGGVMGRIIFVTAGGSGAGLGHFGDLIIIDEAGEVPEKVYQNLIPIVINEGAKLLCISTMYESSLKGWFFDEIVEAEKKNIAESKEKTLRLYNDKFKNLTIKQGDANLEYTRAVELFYQQNPSVGIRYSIYDIDILSDLQRQEAIDEYKKKNREVAMMAELFSRFIDASKVFKYESCVVSKEFDIVNNRDYLVMGYDPAATHDKPGLVILGYERLTKTIGVVYADYLTHDTGQYPEQVAQVNQLEAVYKKKAINFSKVCDGTNSGTIDAFEAYGCFFDRRYKYTGGSEAVISQKIYGELKIPKKMLVELSMQIIGTNSIAIPQKMSKMIKELDGFQKIQSSSGRIEYKGVGVNDDIVNAMMIALYYMYNELGVKFEIHNIEDVRVLEDMSQDQLAEYNLIKSKRTNAAVAAEEYQRQRAKFLSENVF